MIKRLKEWIAWSERDVLLTITVLGGATGLCFLLRSWAGTSLKINTYAIMIYVLAVLLVSRLTNGYFYGIFTALVSVIFVNYVFTYPFYEFNFTVEGYPLTFVTTMAVALITSAMTTQITEKEKLRVEKEKETMRANLLRAVSHDLRTPLTSILGATSAILENEDKLEPAQKTKLLTEVKEDAQWLIRLVENLLSVTRINTGDDRLKKEPELVEEIVAEAVLKFKKHYPDYTVNVRVPEEPLLVPMDATLIEQVINNLLENAARHSDSSEAYDLTVSVRKRSALFQVRDYGKGIPEEKIHTIFEGNFYDADKQGSDSSRDMGIGLSVCMSIIKAHGGKMWASNAQDGGAIFSFWLPMENVGEEIGAEEEEQDE